MQMPLPFAADKRWNHRRECWRRPDVVFDATYYAVEAIEERVAKAFVTMHHYSGTMPAARQSVGLFHKSGVAPAALSGVAVFSVPMQQAVIPKYTGLDPSFGVELGRFVLSEECAFNAETWMLARAFRVLRKMKPEVRAVVSFADPLERHTAEGVLCKPAHRGTIYAASNALLAGRSSSRWISLDREGRVLSERTLSKIRNREQGHDYAERQVVAAGAPWRKVGEDPGEWLTRVMVEPYFRRLKHPGNLAFVFGLDSSTRAQVEAVNAGGMLFQRMAA